MSWLVALWCFVMPAGAEEVPGLDVAPAGPPPSAEEVEEGVYQLTTRLRCPVCQGLNVAESRSEAAVAMQGRIHELVSLGYSQNQVVDYFTDRYGDWVLLDPPREGMNWFLWLGPFVLVLGGVLVVRGVARYSSSRSAETPVEASSREQDPYVAKLLAEVDGES